MNNIRFFKKKKKKLKDSELISIKTNFENAFYQFVQNPENIFTISCGYFCDYIESMEIYWETLEMKKQK